MPDSHNTAQSGGKSPIIRRLSLYLGYLVIFLVAMQLGQIWLQRDVVVGKAPEFSAVNLDGEQVSLAALKGKPLVLYFWGSWCPICRFEHGTITSLAEDYQVLSVALQSGSDNVLRAHMLEHNAVYPVVNDPDGNIGADFGIKGVPTIFLLDAEGEIRNVLSGFTSGISLRLRLWLLSDQ